MSNPLTSSYSSCFVFTKHPLQIKPVTTCFQNMFSSKRAPKQKGGCLDTLDTPWIHHWLSGLSIYLRFYIFKRFNIVAKRCLCWHVHAHFLECCQMPIWSSLSRADCYQCEYSRFYTVDDYCVITIRLTINHCVVLAVHCTVSQKKQDTTLLSVTSPKC